MIRTMISLPLLATIALLVGCTEGKLDMSKVPLNRVIGDRNATMVEAGAGVASAITLSDADEDEMGRTVAIAATNRWRLYDKPNLTKYVTLVGLTLVNESADPGGNWVFGVLDTPEIGAFSGPNGYVMITRGAIAAMEDESELAAVLAHEITHVTNHDGFKAVKNAKLSESVLKGLSATQQRAAIFNQGADLLVDKVLRTGWSREQESAADRGAVDLLIAAGYDPNGLPRFLGRMEQRHVGGSGGTFSTHPGIPDRIKQANAQIGGAKAGATNRERFAKSAIEAKL